MPQTTDDRRINSAIRMPGINVDRMFIKGAVITDPNELMEAAKAEDSTIDLQTLYDSGVISGTWEGVISSPQEAA